MISQTTIIKCGMLAMYTALQAHATLYTILTQCLTYALFSYTQEEYTV